MIRPVTRRAMLAGAIAFAEWSASHAAAGPPKIRASAQSAAGQAAIGKLAQAVALMQQRSEGDPLSWVFQWFTHAIPDNTTKSAEIAKLPPDQQPLAEAMWNTCQAHFGGPIAYFPPWHRMFLYFFERIAGQLIGDPTFALPYWDYTDPAQRALPAPFRSDPTSPLYRPARNTGPGLADVNGGQPLDLNLPGAISLDCVAEPTFLPDAAGGPGFCAALGQNPHKMVHSLIGDFAHGMGKIPWAANDPIFWLHHANIDRVWASWNAAGGRNPTDPSWGGQVFVFADEMGRRVAPRIADFADIAPLGYAYDRLLNVPLIGPRAPAALAAQARPPSATSGPVALGAAAVRAPLRRTAVAALAARPGGRLLLRITGVRAAAEPGTLYAVYLGAASPDRFVGAISFFDSVPMPGMGGMAMDAASDFVFDVTRLAAAVNAEAQPAVTFVPLSPPRAGTRPTVGAISISAA